MSPRSAAHSRPLAVTTSSVSRRTLVRGAAGGLLAGALAAAARPAHAATSSTSAALPAPKDAVRTPIRPLSPPPAAKAAGFTRLTLDEGFSSLSGFDLARTGAAGHTWYLHAPWYQPSISAGDLAILSDSTSDHFLRLTPSATNCNWSLATMDPMTGVGRTFRHGYFEARMRFAPVPFIDWSQPYDISWPSFWALSKPTALGSPDPVGTEIDFFEALNGPNGLTGTIHDNRTRLDQFTNSNADQPSGVDCRTWHTYGCRWSPEIVQWFVDNRLVMTQTWGSRGVSPAPRDVHEGQSAGIPADIFQPLDRNDMLVAFGSGKGRPMDVDFVRIWQA